MCSTFSSQCTVIHYRLGKKFLPTHFNLEFLIESLYYNFVLCYVLRTRHQVIVENEFVSLAADGLAQNDQRLGSNAGTDCTPGVNRPATVGNRVQDAG